MKTAFDESLRINMRKRRADSLASAAFRAISEELPYDGWDRNAVMGALVDLFCQEGVEVLTDHDRQQIGLPARGPDGWTVEELLALDKRRLELLMRPLNMVVPILPETGKEPDA